MALTNIFLARHGQTEYNRLNQIQGRGIDISLNKTGRQQARAIARHLKDIRLDRIYGSSLKRSRETAGIVAKKKGVELFSHPDLDEMDFGRLEGRPISEIETELDRGHENWKSGNISFAFEKGECPRTVLQRAHGRIVDIMREHHGLNLMFVLHGRLIRILLSHWLEYGLSAMYRVPHENGAVYHIRWDGESFEPIYLNYTDHLPNGNGEKY